MRGALAVGILAELEKTLREKLGRPKLVLADYFDLIGGTSTGAIIAAGLALGQEAEYLRGLYHRLGPIVFKQRGFRIPLIQSRFDPSRLAGVIVEELGEATLETAAWRTGFAAVAKRVDTGSASAAAPFYFDMVHMEVTKGEQGIFFDGAMTPHGNPALQLAMTALAPAYGLKWTPGANELMIVSVGTGQPRPMKPEWRSKPLLLSVWKAIHALTSLAYDNSQLGTSILQWLGTSPQPWHINGEIDGLQNSLPGCSPLWTFVRYDAPLEAAWLEEHLHEKFSDAQIADLVKMDDDSMVPELYRVGEKAGENLIKPEHFQACFDPA
jgi:hypothetical protein